MKITVLNLPGYSADGSAFFIKAGSRWSFEYTPTPRPTDRLLYCPYPFMLSYTAQLLRAHGHEVLLFDGVAEKLTPDEALRRLVDFAPQLIITELVTVSYVEDIAFLNIVKLSLGECTIAVGGPHATALWKETLASGPVDMVFCGEYELTACDVAARISCDAIAGLAWSSTEILASGPRQNPRRELVDLADLPSADRESLRNELYRDFCFQEPFAIMMATRGCPMRCDFCIERHVLYGSGEYRTRPVAQILDEMVMLGKKYGVRQVYFDDMTFTVKPLFVNEFCLGMIKRKIKMKWSCMGDLFSGIRIETLRLMRKAGCVGMKFGLETVDEALIRSLGKNLKIKEIQKKVGWLGDLGIFSHGTIMFGLPGDSLESMRKTVEFAQLLDLDSLQYSIATPFPGTPFYQHAVTNGWIKPVTPADFTQFSGAGRSVLAYPKVTAEAIESLFHSYQSQGSGRAWGGKKRAIAKIIKCLYPLYLLRELHKLLRVFGCKGTLGFIVSGIRSVVSHGK